MTSDKDLDRPGDQQPRRGGHRRIVANTAWLFVDKAVGTAVGVVVGAWVARHLRPAAFGQLSYAVAFVQFLVPIAGLGLQSIVIRNLVREPTSKRDILGTALLLRLVVGTILISTLGIAFVMGIGPQDAVLRLLIFVISLQLVFNAVSDTVGDWFESRTELKYIVWARNSATVMVAGLRIVLIILSAPLVMFGAASSAQALIFAIGAVTLFLTTGNRLADLRAGTLLVRELLRDSWPLILTGLAVVTYMRVDQIMLGHLADSETLGEYSAAVYLSELWYFIPVAVARSVYPTIVQFHDTLDVGVFRARIQVFFDAMTLTAYVVAIPLTILAPQLVTILFGPDYGGAIPVLRIHIWTFLFVALGEARYRWLMVKNLVRFAMIATSIGAVMNVGLNLLLIPAYGGVGAAWATLASQAVSAFLSSLIYPPVRPVFRQAVIALLAPLRVPSLARSLAGFKEK